MSNCHCRKNGTHRYNVTLRIRATIKQIQSKKPLNSDKNSESDRLCEMWSSYQSCNLSWLKLHFPHVLHYFIRVSENCIITTRSAHANDSCYSNMKYKYTVIMLNCITFLWQPSSDTSVPANVFGVELHHLVEKEGCASPIPLLIQKSVAEIERRGLKVSTYFPCFMFHYQ